MKNKKKQPTKQGKNKQGLTALKALVWIEKGGQYVRANECQNAITAYRQAELIFRTLIDKGQFQYRPVLAGTLIMASFAFDFLCRPRDTLRYGRQAADLLRDLIATGQTQHRLDLARALEIIGNALSELQRPKDALDYLREAADLLRDLIAAGQTQHRPNLARVLTRMGEILVVLSRPKDAWMRQKMAVDLLRDLIADGQTQHRPDLARVLNDAGSVIFLLHRLEDAWMHFKQAADLFRELIAAGQTQHRPELAGTLTNIGNVLACLQRPEDALDYLREAADLFRELIAAGQTQHRPELAKTLVDTGVALRRFNHPDDALDYHHQAVDLLRDLIAGGQTQHRPELARALVCTGNTLADFQRPEDALDHFQQAVDLFEELIAAGQAHFGLDLAHTLFTMAPFQWGTGDFKTITRTVDSILDVWGSNDIIPVTWLNDTPLIAAMIFCTQNIAGFIGRTERLGEQLNRTLHGVSPRYLGQFYPLAEATFKCLLAAALNRGVWELALTLAGTARAQRLAKLAQADLLHRTVQAEDSVELCEYRDICRRFVELEMLLNVNSGPSDRGFTGDPGLHYGSGQQYAAFYAKYTDLRSQLDRLRQASRGLMYAEYTDLLSRLDRLRQASPILMYAEYTDLHRQLDRLEQVLKEQGLLPTLEVGLFDGAALHARLSLDEALVILFQFGMDGDEQTVVFLLTREHGLALAMDKLPHLAGRLASITSELKRYGRGLREGPQVEEVAPNNGVESINDPGPVDVQAEALTRDLTQDFWEPISQALGIGEKTTTVWLIPAGQLHGLPWQASAPPGLRCRVVPAPWFVQQALNRPESPAPLIPTVENPLGILAYDAPTTVERQHGSQEKELFHLALEQTLIQAVWGEAVHPLTGLDASHPPAAFVALAGHGQSDADIPGAARVWVGRQDDGERRYVGFGDLWRTPLNLQSIYLSSCVVGMTREVNGEPMGLLSAGLLRGARYLVGWTVPVDDLGVALFSLLYHWAWREHQDPETALTVARQAFLSGDWPEATLELARQHLGTHIQGLMNRYLEIPDRRVTEKNRLREVLDDLIGLAIDPAADDPVNPFWEALRSRDDGKLRIQANRLADGLLARRHHLPCRYVGWFALGCG